MKKWSPDWWLNAEVSAILLYRKVKRWPAYGRPTGATRWNGRPHRQPRRWRIAWCKLRGHHGAKMDTHPRGSCPGYGWWPQ